ncbi:MAG: hydratase [Oribacterium sp.]|nr:hydratase [Oribacterium sp.]MBP3806716.1 hydratase [Oribacterium sp.]
MIKLHEGKKLILNDEVIASVEEHPEINPEDAKKETLTYRVLKAHNQSEDMENLLIKFDEMGVYDNTYVGILQTAVASGLKKFPMPTVFTNCHNCLAAVGGTINTDVHKYAETACHKYGGIFVPPHEAVIHQYMREMLIKSGDMAIVSDSHTRYGTQGSVSIGEGGPELAKAMIGKFYEIKYPKVIAVFLHGAPKPWVGPMDVALTLIGATFKNKFVKNAVLEFIGPGVHSMSMDFRNGIDTMTTESACLSSIWETDDEVRKYFEIHKRPQDYKQLKPGKAALYDAVVEIDLDTVEPMIALPYHPSNAFPLKDVIENPEKYAAWIEEQAVSTFENTPDIHPDIKGKITPVSDADSLTNGFSVDRRIRVDQANIAGCAAGSFENIYAVDAVAKAAAHGLGQFPFNIYPASQPIMVELNRVGVMNDLMIHGVRVKTAFCGPCFGASDCPENNAFTIRHSTRNFPNREGSKPGQGQVASAALMDSKSIAATAFNGGLLTSAEEIQDVFNAMQVPKYEFNENLYANVVYNGFGKEEPETEIQYGPAIKDWPEMSTLTDNLLLRVASVIRDEVTTTDELIPSGETASYRSNPYKISEFTLQRKDPAYVPNAKDTQTYEKARLKGDKKKASEFYAVLKAVGIDVADESILDNLMKTTGIGSVLYAKRPGDGSAREYAASCQKVLGGLANICIDYATKRYRSNCVNWGMLPFTYPDDNIKLAVGEYVWLPDIRKSVMNNETEVKATIIGIDGNTREMILELKDVTESEKKILLAGSMINSYREDLGLN